MDTTLFLNKARKRALSVSIKHPAPKGWVKVQGSVDPRFVAGLPFPASEILESLACLGD